MALEICIYLAIAFGTLVLCITMLEKDNCIQDNYVMLKRENVKVKVIIETEGIDEEDAKRIGWIIRKGKYQDIYDVANDFELLNKENA